MQIESLFSGINNLLIPHDVSVITYYDRIHLFIDSQVRNQFIKTILSWNDKNKLTDNELVVNSHFNRKLELFQLKPSHLTYLQQHLGDHAINWVEFAWDFMTSDRTVHQAIDTFFNRHLVRKNTINKACNFFYTDRYEPYLYLDPIEADCREEKYSDKPARMSDEDLYCVHLEYRIRKLENVKKQRVITIKNLIDFGHEDLWNNLLDLRYCNNTELGRLLLDSSDSKPTEFSRKTYNKHGCNEWSSIDLLQRYLHDFPELESAFKPIQTEEKLRKVISEYF